MVQIRIDRAFSDTENPQAFDEILLSIAGNDDFVKSVLIADIFQPLQRIVDGEVGLLGVHSQILVGGAACQDAVYQFQVVMCVLEGRQQHFLCGIGIDGIHAGAEALLFIQTAGHQHPYTGIHIRGIPVGFRGKKGCDQGRLAPV